MRTLKKKGTLWMLLVVATGIWGVIVVRLINLTDAPRLTSVEPIRHEDEMSGLKDTLLLNYRDPFLGSIPVKVISRGKKREPRVLVSPMEELAPSFILLGKIQKGEKDFLLVESGGENRLITPTDKIDGFTIKKVYTDSIIVCKGKNKYTIQRN